MNLIPWKRKLHDGDVLHPEPSLARFRDEIDTVFDRFLRNPWGSFETGLDLMGGFPRTDLAESENEFTVTMEMPGVDAGDLNIEVTDGALMVRGEKKHEEKERQRNFHYVERSYGTFSRTIPLPSSADSKKVDARCKDGVLTVTIAKRRDAKSTRINVKSD